MSFSRAAGSPLRSAAKVSTSSFGVSGHGKLPESRWSARYRNFVAKNCKKILNAALSDLRAQRRREKAQYQGAPFADVFQVKLILSEEDSDRACIVDVGNTGMSYVIPWSSIPQELQQPLRRYVAQANGKLCGYCKENLCNTENGRMIVELYLGKQDHHVSRILY